MTVLTVGVLGAGTMGRGIGLSAALAGYRTVICEPDANARAQAGERLEKEAMAGARREHWTASDAKEALNRVTITEDRRQLEPASLVIEAVFEQLDVKQQVLAQALEICGPSVALATNTSSLSISRIAAGLDHPARLVGMHFFNPVTRMPLVELVAGAATGTDVIEIATEVAEGMGKTVVAVRDTLGFIVNRCLRPFYGEALRIVADGTATAPQVDALIRDMGFPMGPFELIDLVGVDVNLDIQRSFYEQSFGEPRWRPSRLQAEIVAAGWLGRKTGRGFHSYEDGRRIETAPADEVIDVDTEALKRRMKAMIANEGWFAVQEKVAEADDIDRAMELGVNWPAGPLALGRELGLERVIATLESLQDELGDDRYRVAPALRRAASK